MSADSIVVRNCHGLDELRACVALQKEVWNFTDTDLVPLRMFVVAEVRARRNAADERKSCCERTHGND